MTGSTRVKVKGNKKNAFSVLCEERLLSKASAITSVLADEDEKIRQAKEDGSYYDW